MIATSYLSIKSKPILVLKKSLTHPIASSYLHHVDVDCRLISYHTEGSLFDKGVLTKDHSSNFHPLYSNSKGGFVRKYLCLFIILVFFSTISKSQNCTVNAGLPQTICPGGTINLSGIVTGNLAPNANAHWTAASGPSGSIVNPNSATTSVVGFGSSTTSNTILVYRYSAECQDSIVAFQDVVITVLPNPGQPSVGPNVTVCATGTYGPLAGSAIAAGDTGIWTSTPASGVVFSNLHSPTSNYTLSAPGVFTFTWKITGPGGCSNSSSMTVTQNGPAAISAGADINLSCAGNSVKLIGSNPGLSPQVGLWTLVSGPNTPTFANPNFDSTKISNLIPGTYKLVWHVSGPCASGQDTMVLTVHDINTTQTAASGTNLTFCVGSGVTQALLSGTVPNPGVTALWTATIAPATGTTIVSPGSGNTLITGLNSSAPAVYTYNYKLTTGGGCISTTTRTISFVSTVSVVQPAIRQYVLPCGSTSTTIPITRNYPAVISGSNVYTSSTALAGTASSSVRSVGLVDTWTLTGLTANTTNIIRLNYNSPCGNTYVDVEIVTSSSPSSTSNGGSDQILPCTTLSTALAGNSVSSPNIGTWYWISGPNTPTIANPHLNTTGITGLIYGNYLYRWVVTNGSLCPGISDTVMITAPSPLAANSAGRDTTICYATPYKMNSSGMLPGQSVYWTVSPSAGITFSPSNAVENPIINGTSASTVYTFVKTLTIPCDSTRDTVLIKTTASKGPPPANAGNDSCVSSSTLLLSGNDPSPYVGTWSSAGKIPGTITSPSTPTTTVTGMTPGTYTFVWTINGGACGITRDTVVETVNATATISNAGADQSLCNATSTTLSGNAPIVGIGAWTQTGGAPGATIANPSSNATSVSGLTTGDYIFTWTITNGICSSNSSSVNVSISSPTLSSANAGPTQTTCAGSTTLAGNQPAAGESGFWDIVAIPPASSNPTFTNNSLYNTVVSGLSTGMYVFQWSIIKPGACPASTSLDTVYVTAPATITGSVASSYCNDSAIILYGTTGTNGTWSATLRPAGAPSVTFTSMNSALSYASVASNLVPGAYTFRYDIAAAGSCPASFATKNVSIASIESVANAGPDINVCAGNTSGTLAAITPTTGTGAWTKTSGPNTPGLSSASSPTSNITGLVPGTYIYTWTVSNSPCPSSTATMQINVASAASAGVSQNLCSATSTSLSGNIPVIGVGAWTQVSGPSRAAISSPNSPVTGIDSMTPGVYVFQWSTPLGACPSNVSTTNVVNFNRASPPIIGTITQPTCSAPSGSVALSGLPSSGTWTMISNPATLTMTGTGTSALFSGLYANTSYNFTITDANGCTSTVSNAAVISPQPYESATISSQTNVSCYGQSTGSAAVTAGAGTISYLWSPGGSTSPTVASLPAGTYSVTVRDNNNCTALASVIITQPTAALSSSVTTQTNVSCYGTSIGSFSIQAANGTAPYQYALGSGAYGNATIGAYTQSGVAAGSYTVNIKDANGCTASQTVIITQPSAALSSSITAQVNISCFGASTGSFTIQAANGTAPYQYALGSGAYGNATTGAYSQSTIAAGSYTVNIKDAKGCTTSQIINITQPIAALSSSITAQTNVSCFGMSTGSFSIQAANGTAPYQYALGNGAYGNTTAGAYSLSDIAAGTYIINIRDAKGCTTTQTVIITQPSAALSSNTTAQTNISCFGAIAGSFSIQAANGTAPYQYALGSGAYGNATTGAYTQSGVAAGTYVVNIKDAKGCTTSQTINITQPTAALNSTITGQTNVSCYGTSTGSFSIQAANGTAPYQYALGSGAYGTATTGAYSLSTLNAGSYTVNIKDANGCTASQTVIITQPSAALTSSITAQTNISCFGSSTGSFSVQAANGTAPYQYALGSGAYGNSTTGAYSQSTLSAGSYTINIMDAKGCTASQTVIVTQPSAALSSSITAHNNVSCYGASTGSYTVQAANGTAPYQYALGAGAYGNATYTAYSQSSVAAGSYTITIKDSKGCTTSQTITTTQPSAPLSVSVIPSAPSNASVTASGGTPNYSYQWNTTPVQSTADITGIPAGIYTVVVSDSNGCSASKNLTITASTIQAVSDTGRKVIGLIGGTAVTNVLRNDLMNGATLSPSQVTTSFISSTNTGITLSGADVIVAPGTPASNYTLTYQICEVLNPSVCSRATVSVPVIVCNLTASANYVSPICTAANGSISVSMHGGTSPFTYQWSNGSNSPINSALLPGTFTLTITDVNSCTIAQSYTLNAVMRPLTLSATSVSDTCGSGKGSASVSVTSSASSAPFAYAWANSRNTPTITGLNQGSYPVSVTDANGCSSTANASITNYVYTFNANITSTRPICTTTNGTLQITTSGGRYPYSFRWNTGDSTSSLSSLAAGSYTVTISDANTCTVSRSQTLSVSTPVISTSASPIGDTCSAHIGRVSASVAGGTAPYNYLWSNGGTSSVITGLGAHYYSFVATDINGCTATAGASVSNLGTAIVISGNVTQPSCYGGVGAIAVSVSGGTSGLYNLVWNNGASGYNLSSLYGGTYSLSVSGQNGCSANKNFTVTSPDSINLQYIVSPIKCDSAIGGRLTQSILTGANYPLSINWTGSNNFSSSSMNLNHLNAGNYNFNLTDARGCTAHGSYSINSTGNITASYLANNTSCPGVSNGSIQRISLVPYSSPTFHWTGPAAYTSDSASIKNIGPGVYTLMVTEPYGCTATITDTVYSGPAASMQYHMTPVKCDSALGGSLINTGATNTNTPWNISWTGPNNFTSSSTNINHLAGGYYTLQFTDSRGCGATEYFTVDSSGALSANYNPSNITCHGANNGAVNYVSLRPYSSLAQYQWTGPNGYSSSAQSISGLAPGLYTSTISENFGCKAVNSYNISEMFDVGVASIKNINCPASGIHMIIHPIAGDISQLSSNHCASGVSGQVTMTFSGPIHYEGTTAGSLTPVSNGDTLTWTVPDYGTMRIDSSFFARFYVDTTAVLGSQICVTVTVTPLNGDYNPSNNTMTYCMTVIQAYDPNQKQVFPQGDITPEQKNLTYTIQFQNIGTGPAQHVYIHDTLDASIDPTSLTVLASSYPVQTIVSGNAIKFDFVNINLSPAVINPDGSNGWIQYKVKLRDQLSAGMQIKNTAHIYFDYNDPMATNTTVNRIVSDESTGISVIGKNIPEVVLSPDPARSYIFIKSNLDVRGGYLEMYDTEGRKCKKVYVNDQNTGIDVSDLAQGMYTVNLIYSTGQNVFKKLIIER